MEWKKDCKQQLAALCKNLAALRREHELTIEELSRQTDVPEKVLLEIEKGMTKRFYADHLVRLSRFYHVMPSTLLEEFPDNPAAHREY